MRQFVYFLTPLTFDKQDTIGYQLIAYRLSLTLYPAAPRHGQSTGGYITSQQQQQKGEKPWGRIFHAPATTMTRTCTFRRRITQSLLTISKSRQGLPPPQLQTQALRKDHLPLSEGRINENRPSIPWGSRGNGTQLQKAVTGMENRVAQFRLEPCVVGGVILSKARPCYPVS